jgi:riboflavin synthase
MDMFTGIIKGVGEIVALEVKTGLVSYQLKLPKELTNNIEIGASIAVDGVCITVVSHQDDLVTFDLMQESLNLTTLGQLNKGSKVNIERSAQAGVEVGGHILSGHVDCTAKIIDITKPENNCVFTFEVQKDWMKYIFSKGFVALNGTSLTITDANKSNNTFKVWFIPETLRATTFGLKNIGDEVNLEVERNTQVIVDTVRDYLAENIKNLI